MVAKNRTLQRVHQYGSTQERTGLQTRKTKIRVKATHKFQPTELYNTVEETVARQNEKLEALVWKYRKERNYAQAEKAERAQQKVVVMHDKTLSQERKHAQQPEWEPGGPGFGQDVRKTLLDLKGI